MKRILYTLLCMMLCTGAWAQTSLQEQINNAEAGTTITLTGDVTISQTVLINKNITINAANHTITSSVNNILGAFYVNTGTCTLTIQNANFDGGNTGSMAVVAYRGVAKDDCSGVVSTDNNNAGNVITLTDCTVKNFTGYPGSYVGAVYAFSHSTFNLNNCTFTGNTTSQSADGASGADVWAGAAATVHINGGSYDEIFVNSNAGDHASITISNGATVEELAVCVTDKGAGETNQPNITIDNATVNSIVTETGNSLPTSAVTVPTFTVTDGVSFSIPYDFTASTASYSRTMPAGTTWGTVCLPFTLKQGYGTSSPKLYTFGNISGDVLTVNEVDTEVAPGTPVIFSCDAPTAVFTTENATVTTATPATGTLVGTYTQQNITSGLENIYFINGDKFHQAKASLTVPAYRAYINYSGAGAKAAVLQIAIDGEASAIETVTADMNTATVIYDANGRKLSAPQKGMNIMKLANGKTLKLIVK